MIAVFLKLTVAVPPLPWLRSPNRTTCSPANLAGTGSRLGRLPLVRSDPNQATLSVSEHTSGGAAGTAGAHGSRGGEIPQPCARVPR